MTPARILITGGLGFIGSHLAHLACQHGKEVTVLDDGSSPIGPGGPAVQAMRVVQGSVCDADLVDRLVASCDAVFHLAAVVGVRRVLEMPVRTLVVNTDGTSRVLEAAAKHGKSVVYTSSSEVYGSGVHSPFSEDDALIVGPAHVTRWCYALSKLHGEMMGFEIARAHGIGFTAARMFNVVGPGQRADQGMVLPRFAAAAVCGEPVRVYAPGTQRRCYLHVRDAARLLWKLLDVQGAAPLTVNVGGPESRSVLDVAEAVVQATGGASRIDLIEADGDLPPGFAEVHERVPNLDRLHALVGPWQRADFAEIVADVVAAARLYDGPSRLTGHL